jgi:hypothetical protein
MRRCNVGLSFGVPVGPWSCYRYLPCTRYRYLAISLSSYLANDSYTTRHLSAHRLVVVAPQLLLDFSPSAAQRRSPSLRLQPAATQYSTFSIGPKHSLVEHLPRKWKVGREASLGRTGHRPTDCALTHVHLEPQKGTRFVLTFMPRFLCRAYYTPAQAKTMRAYPPIPRPRPCPYRPIPCLLASLYTTLIVKERNRKNSHHVPSPPDAPTQTPSAP